MQHHHSLSDRNYTKGLVASVEDQRERKQVRYLFFFLFPVFSCPGKAHHGAALDLQVLALSPAHRSSCPMLSCLQHQGFISPLRGQVLSCTSYITEPLKTFSTVLMAIGNPLQTVRSTIAVLKTAYQSKSMPEHAQICLPSPASLGSGPVASPFVVPWIRHEVVCYTLSLRAGSLNRRETEANISYS